MKILSLLIFISCSSLGDKKVYTDEVQFSGGRFQKTTWEDRLNFKRVSWYSRATLEFDVYLSEIKKDSGFTQWFSGGEKKYLSECNKIYVSMSTSQSSRVLSDAMYVREMNENSLSEVLTPNFIQHLKLHPDFVRWNMTMYNPKLFCAKTAVDSVSINFPSFDTVKINL